MNYLTLILAALACLVPATWYGRPELLRPALTELNRKRAGLEEHTMTLGRHRIHYLAGGQGETVVLLHGIFGEKDHWVDLAASCGQSDEDPFPHGEP